MNQRDHLIEKHLLADYQKLYRVAISYVRNEQDAMDVVQEAACRAIRGSDTLKDTGSISAWLYRIVINTSLDFLRQKQRRWEPLDEIPEEYFTDEGETPEERLIRTSERINLMELLDLLEERERTVLVLRYFEDQKLSDIADITGENLNTVKSRLYRALQKLKDCYLSQQNASERIGGQL